MSSDAMYTATATAWGGRQGKVESTDGRLKLDLSRPASMGGDDGPGTNPEQLFAAGYSACFHSALQAVARGRKVDVSGSAVSVTVALTGELKPGELRLRVGIEAEIPGLEPAAARELVEAAHQLCPYSNATRGNIEVDVTVVDGG